MGRSEPHGRAPGSTREGGQDDQRLRGARGRALAVAAQSSSEGLSLEPSAETPLGTSQLLRLQQGVGNRAVTRLIGATAQRTDRAVVQRQPVSSTEESSTAAPTSTLEASEGVSEPDVAGGQSWLEEEEPSVETVCREVRVPEDVARRLIAVRMTLSKLTPLSQRDETTIARAIPGAPIVELIRRRDELRSGIEATQGQMALLYPPGGQPESDQTQHEIASLSEFAEQKRLELEELEIEIEEIVRRAGAGSESELAQLVEKDFPRMFIERGKAIAMQQLSDNRAIVEAEAARFGVTANPLSGTIEEEISGGVAPYVVSGQPSPEDARGFREAAREVLALRRAREDAENQMYTERSMEDEYAALQAGIPDPVLVLQHAQAAEQEALQRQGLRFPLIYRADLEAVVGASDDQLAPQVHSQITTLIGNIEETRGNISDGKLEVWDLRGIVDLTMVDLGIPEDSPLIDVVESYVRDAKSDRRLVELAKTALAITAGLVAAFATGGTALVAGAIAFGVSAEQLSESVDRYMVESAASDVALDPEIADISVNEPELLPIVIGIVSLGLDAAALGKAISALRGPARALLTEGDLVEFSAAAHRVLPAAEAEQLVARAARLPEVSAARAAVGTAGSGTAWTHDQILDLFTRAFKRPGPPQGSIVFHATEAEFEAAARAAGVQQPNVLGFFSPVEGALHLPPTASTITVLHESLHLIAEQTGVRAILGGYVDEGLTEWLARAASGPEAARHAYDTNVAFVRLLGREVGEETLQNAFLHGRWGELRAALAAKLGGQAPVEQFYRLLRQVGPNGERGGVLTDAMEMLWPGSAAP